MLRCDVLLHQCDTCRANRDKARALTLDSELDATRDSKRYLVKPLREADRKEEAAAVEATLPPEQRKRPF
jgi:hypothetical protein